MVIVPRTSRKAMLASIKAESGYLDGAVCKLYKNSIAGGPNTELDVIEPADFDGYATSTEITWGGVALGEDDKAKVLGDRKEWVPTGTTTPNTVYGAYITNAAGTQLIAVLPFEAPVYVTGPDDVVSVVPEVTLPWDETA